MPAVPAGLDVVTSSQDDTTRALLAAIINSSQDAIIGKTLDGIVISWNAGAEALYGYTAAEMIGQHISRLLPSDRHDELIAIMERLRRGETVEPYDTERMCKDGRRIHVLLSVSPVKARDGRIIGASAIAHDITERKWTEALLAGERQVLELVAQGVPLPDVLATLTRMMESLAGESLLASILLLDEDGAHLRHGAGPSLPESYTRAIDGIAIGPEAGSCGTAAYRREPVIVADVATDPLWAGYRDLALRHGLRACWSTPIRGADGRILGTFAFYYHAPRRPSREHMRLAAMVSRTAAVVIERRKADDVQRRLEAEREQLLRTERRARAAAERAQHLLTVQNALGRILADTSLAQAPALVLQTLCRGLGWDCGVFWEVDREASALRHVAFWHLPETPLREFEDASRHAVFAPGQGLPGRVWESGQATWIPDLACEASFVRATAAAQVDLRSALAVPVWSGGRVVGVLEFFSRSPRLPEDDLLAAVSTLGWQIGQFIERCRGDEALRASEARFRELFEHAPVAYQELDVEGRFVRVNRALCDLLGYTPEELLGRPIWDFKWAHGEPAEETRRRFFEKLAHAEPWHAVERVRVRKDGSLRTVWVEDQLVRDSSGRVTGLLTAQLDITERKRAEEGRAQLYEAERAARAEAEAAIAARDAMYSTVTHDRKNPLAGIRGWAQLLRRRLSRGDSMDTEQMLQALGQIESTARRMTALLEDLLDAARLQAGGSLELRRRPTDLVALALEAVQEHQQLTEQHVIRFSAGVPALVGTWDGDRLERVLGNLLSNAVKFSPQGGEITVEVRGQGREAIVVVRDRGLGIPAADLPHVFDRFRRASNVIGRITGTGLGLSGAREIVVLHGGDIQVQSQEGAGTTVTVRLPLEQMPAA